MKLFIPLLLIISTSCASKPSEICIIYEAVDVGTRYETIIHDNTKECK